MASSGLVAPAVIADANEEVNRTGLRLGEVLVLRGLITREALASLFDTGVDPLVVIRWKDLFERLENAIDAAEHVAYILEGIVIKNS